MLTDSPNLPTRSRIAALAPSVALCAALAACAPAAPPPPPAPPAPLPEPIDGIYRGTSTRFQADLKSCPHPGLVLIVVQNHQFSYHWSYGVYIDGTITDDGAIQGSAPNFTMVGKRDGKKLDGDVTNGNCGLHFTVMKTDH